MNKDDKILLVDLDGTLADYDGELKRGLARLRSDTDDPCFYVNFDDYSNPAWLNARIDLIKKQTNWWLNLPKIECNFKVLKAAEEIGFKIHVLTQGPKRTASAWIEKLLWCQKHLGENVDITITRDKSLSYGRILMDDYPKYMDNWLKYRPRGLGIMPINGYNVKYNHPNVVKFDGNNLSEVIMAMQKAYDRKAGNESPNND